MNYESDNPDWVLTVEDIFIDGQYPDIAYRGCKIVFGDDQDIESAVEEAQQSFCRGELQKAKDLLEVADQMLRDQPDSFHPERVEIQKLLGFVLRQLGEYAQAEYCFERVVSELNTTGQGDTTEVAYLSLILADLLYLRIDAPVVTRQLRAQCVSSSAINSLYLRLKGALPETRYLLTYFGWLLNNRIIDESGTKYLQSSAGYEKAVFNKDVDVVVGALIDLSLDLERAEFRSEAIQIRRHSLDLLKEAREPAYPLMSSIQCSLSHALLLEDRLEEAVEVIEQAVGLRQAFKVGNDEVLVLVLNGLGFELFGRQLLPEADRLIRYALNIQQSSQERDATGIADNLRLLAQILKMKGEGGPEELLLSALNLYPEENDKSLECRFELATYYMLCGKLHMAEAGFEELLEIHRAMESANSDSIAKILVNLGGVHFILEQYDDAERVLREALAVHRGLKNEEPLLAHCLNCLGVTLVTTGRYEEAEILIREAVDISKALPGGNELMSDVRQQLVVASQSILGLLLYSSGQDEEGERRMNEAEELVRRAFGDNHPLTVCFIHHKYLIYEQHNIEGRENLREFVMLRINLLSPTQQELVRNKRYLFVAA